MMNDDAIYDTVARTESEVAKEAEVVLLEMMGDPRSYGQS